MLRSKIISLLRFVCITSTLPSCGQLILHLSPVMNITVRSASLSSNIFTLSRNSGPVGTILTLTGADFSSAQTFSIGNTAGIILSYSSTSLIGFVMPGSTSGIVTVMNANTTTISSFQLFTVTATGVPLVQQGAKLLASDSFGSPSQGTSVSISADGNTAIVGGSNDNSNIGAAWVFVRNGTTWSQQGLKLTGSGATGAAYQGASVSLSADGNTALIGGSSDSGNTGAAWVFTRSGFTWTQQGAKLVGGGSSGASHQGIAVSLSADGNTALIGGFGDNFFTGATWVFIRNGSTWTQQGSKLVGSVASGASSQGASVSLSADGNTALIGGSGDNGSIGAAWVFTRSGSLWTQQGGKLLASDYSGTAQQGYSARLSADGNTALIGGSGDNASTGAAWVFTRSGSTWTQQGLKLVGSLPSGAASQGTAVSLSADGNTALIGGSADNGTIGATWVFTRSGSTWTQQGANLVGTGYINDGFNYVHQGDAVSLSADGSTALVGGWSDNTNLGATWVFTP